MQNWLAILLLWLYIFQIISLVAVIFIENKDPVTTMSWILVLTFLPIIGFILYLFLGRGLTILSRKRRKLSGQIRKKQEYNLPLVYDYFKDTRTIMSGHLPDFTDPVANDYIQLMKMNTTLSASPYTQNNDVKIYTTAREKYDDLFKEIKAAKVYIHLCYFMITNTPTSYELMDLLAEKASEGVEVILIYDAIGNFFVPSKLYQPLKKAGGQVLGFFPLSFKNLLHANYRTHDKIIVIDGQIGYTGGMNIGDEYLGLHPRKTPWRDTHLRLVGDIVPALQFTFLLNLFYTTDDEAVFSYYLTNRYFQMPKVTGNIGMQLVTSGPDDPHEAIKRAFIKLINSATKTLYIQTPYLMPDQPVLEALQIAASSGVDVQIMIPGIPDKKVVYHVTTSYIQYLLDYGVKVFIYNGFLHAKAIVIDDQVCTIGTTNLDMRSFSLHFEMNTIIYNQEISKSYGDVFRKDLLDCYEMTTEIYDKRGIGKRIVERIFRLMAPLM